MEVKRARAGLPRGAAILGLLLLLGPGLLPAALLPAARACDVPLFRYALRYWEASPYEVTVYHDAPLSKEDRERIEALRHVNLRVGTVALRSTRDEPLLQLYGAAGSPAAPCAVLSRPLASPDRAPLAALPLARATAAAFCSSPARSEMTGLLLDGSSAVWVLLKSGNVEKDRRAASVLREELDRIVEALNRRRPRDGAEPERIRFDLLSLARDDRDETILTAALLRTEPDLAARTGEPFVFPVFGRARALYALAGRGITAENIAEAAATLVAGCTCEVKDESPGADLPTDVDWEREVGRREKKTLLLETTAAFASLAEAREFLDPAAAGGVPDPGGAGSGSPLFRNVLILFGALLLAVALLAWRVLRSPGEGAS